MSVYLVSKRSLASPWIQSEFVRYVTEGLVSGAMVMSAAAWPGYDARSIPSWRFELDAASPEHPYVPALDSYQIMRLAPLRRGRMNSSDYAMVLRAASELGKPVVPRKRPHSTKPVWWDLEVPPSTVHAARSYLKKLSSLLDTVRGAARFITSDRLRWVRIQTGSLARIDFERPRAPRNRIWGVFAEGPTQGDAELVAERLDELLPKYGRRI